MKRKCLTAAVMIVGFGNVLAASPSAFDIDPLRGWAVGNAIFVPAGPIPVFEVIRVADAGQKTSVRQADIVNERNQLFMLAAMAYVYAHHGDYPAPGYEIAALIAWDVDNVSQTPMFVMERNRNFENEGSKYHAEMMTLDKAYRALSFVKSLPESWLRPETRAALRKKLANTVLYATLEPCPMCHSTILMQGVPKVVYCMEDPRLRDPASHLPLADPDTHMTNRAYGYTFSVGPSSLARCVQANAEMWSNTVRWREGRNPEWGRFKYFSVTDYLHDQAVAIYRPAFETLFTYTVQFSENQELLQGLRKAVGKPNPAAQ